MTYLCILYSIFFERSGIYMVNFYIASDVCLNKNKTMKKTLYVFGMLWMMAAACTSGQDSPVDSHPGSSSVKQDADPKDSSITDTTKAIDHDSL